MRVIPIICLLVLSFACKKSSLQNDCDDLKQAIITSDVMRAQSAIDNIIIKSLPSSRYTESNLQNLINRISADCDVQVELGCFDCIKTLPSQSEIRITINSASAVIQKVIDISYTSSNLMTFRNMHE